MEKYTLKIDSVCKDYGRKKILTDIYLECSTGEIIGVLGRNGTGKTTLLKIIYGIENAENKFIKLNETVLNTEKLIFKNISFLSQSSFIPKYFSVKKSIKLSIESSKIIEFYNDEFIQNISENSIVELSTGELRYLEVKLLLFNDSKFCLLDEPFSGLSPIMIEKISFLILKYASNKGFVITDHNYREIMKISTRLILIKNGKSITIKDYNELIDYNYLTSL